MATTIGLVLIEGVRIDDLSAVGWRTTDVTASGHEVLLTGDPAACEVEGGVLIAQGRTDIALEDETYALILGTRLVAVGVATADKTYVVSVYGRDGVVRHVVDTLEERTFDVGEPLAAERDITRLDEASTLRIFESLTGLTLDDVRAADLTVLRPPQEHDEMPRRPLLKRLLGIHSDKEGYATKTGPPVLAKPEDG